MAITSLDQIVAASKQRRPFYKASMTSKAAGTFQSLWTAAGQPGAGAAPGAASIPTSATAGALAFTNPVSALSYLSAIQVTGATVGSVILYDRVAHMSGLNATLTTAQSVNTPTLTRSVDGLGLEIWVEWYTATGATASNITCSYTNESSTSGRTTVSQAFQVSAVAGQMLRLPLQSGDRGVKSVQSVTLSASTATAGNFGITLVEPIVILPINAANIGTFMDALATAMPQIEDSACLSLMVLCSTTSTGVVQGMATLAQG